MFRIGGADGRGMVAAAAEEVQQGAAVVSDKIEDQKRVENLKVYYLL